MKQTISFLNLVGAHRWEAFDERFRSLVSLVECLDFYSGFNYLFPKTFCFTVGESCLGILTDPCVGIIGCDFYLVLYFILLIFLLFF